MEEDRDMPKRSWDTCREVPVIEDEQTPWKLIKLLKLISLCVVGVLVFGLAISSKTSFLLMITYANEDTKILPADQKPVALLCIGCSLISSSVILFLKSFWKACYKTSKPPRKTTIALVLFFEFLVSLGAAVLTIVAMPHLDIVTNVTILNSIGILSALLQVVAQCTAKERNRYLLPSITAFVLILIGHVLFIVLYIMKDTKTAIWVGLAVGGSFLVSFNWWENYFTQIGEKSKSNFLKNFCKDMKRSQNMLHILSSMLRIGVTASVLGAYVPLSKMDWDVVTSIPSRETRIIVITIGVQLISSALCHWFAVTACKMHALRRCFILPLYLASLAVMALLIIPVIVYYQDYRISLNGTANVNFTGYCTEAVFARNQSLNGSVFPHLVLDVTHTLCFLDMSNITDIGLLTGSSVAWWLGLVLATIHLWHLHLHRIQRTQDLFIRRLYEGAFIEQSLLFNTRFEIQIKDKSRRGFQVLEKAMVYLCATMWHETYDEMIKIIISIFRLDKYRPNEDSDKDPKRVPKFNDFTFEAHIYFDDAFTTVPGRQGPELNEFAKTLVGVLTEVYGIFVNIDEKLFKKQQQVPDQKIIKTPYGGRLVLTMPHGNNIVVHFKNKELIRHKKRWSQVMYLFYLLGWKLMTKYYKRLQRGENEKDLQKEIEKHNTYILALDGDTDFQPTAVMLLIDRLKMYPHVGAACGRIHPTGSGPAVWFQKFEYAISHWLQKTAEHVIGCVLCSPGCFSLFRGDALMDDNVMKRYSTKSTEASHHIQYDQGEDRWLCTLLLKQGWRVEYVAASDAYTNAPEDFKELYNQRRRWGPSTMANVVDLLGSTNTVAKKNRSMSKLYMFYQLFAMVSVIVAPATICLLVAGSLSFIFKVSSNAALIMAVIPPAIYLGLCFKLKPDTQVTIAAILSILYAFLMLVVTMSIIVSMVRDQTILTPSSLFVVAMALMYIITAMMHPQEFLLLFHGFLYIICVPSAYLLLTIYSMVNMTNSSWGTRETKPATGAATTTTQPQTTSKKAISTFTRFLSWIKCCKKSRQGASEELNVSQENQIPEHTQPELQPQNTIVEDVHIPEKEERPQQSSFDCPEEPHCWVRDLKSLSDDMHLQEDTLNQEEEKFFEELQEKYLKPLVTDKETQEKIADDLRELRNKINFAFFIVNALWLVATFSLQFFGTTLTIKIPKINLLLEKDGDITVEPIGFMFILGFALSILIQFLTMFYHRIYTLIHYVAFTDTERKDPKPESKDEYLAGKKLKSTSNSSFQEDSEPEDSDDGDYDDDDDDIYTSMWYRQNGTQV
ncbi:chitin synthase chs-2-like [Scomber scombrus]|uniref:chitin synthase chs-2-like n=1 Tax=Scomber scombrus TaxID=13677 RepID=UPI002DD8A6A7|nr:chitin synthase chs-2-like [Scomber scombrus]